MAHIVKVGDRSEYMLALRDLLQDSHVVDDVLQLLRAHDGVVVDRPEEVCGAGVPDFHALAREVLLGQLDSCWAEVEPDIVAGKTAIKEHVGELRWAAPNLEDGRPLWDAIADGLPHR